ncbi:hypothetical protein GEMRC1_007955 [Eukaryota sp. GEM-RC1]
MYTYLWVKLSRFWSSYDYDFYLLSRGLFKALLFIATILIPWIFFWFLILAAIFDYLEYGSTNTTLAILFFIPALIQAIILTALLTQCYRHRSDSSDITTRNSVIWKNILVTLYGLLLLLYGIWTWVWALDSIQNETTQFVIASITQWLVWLTLWAWHATWWVELDRIRKREEDVGKI